MPEKTTGISVAELRALEVFGWLPPARLDVLRHHMTVLRVKRGDVLYRPGQLAKHIYCVLHGAVGLSLLGSEDRVVQLALLTRGEFFGETALVRGWRRMSQAVAFRDSRVGRIEARTFVTEVCGLPWEIFSGLTERLLKPLFLVSLRRSLFLVEELLDRVALALWEYAAHPEARRARGLLPSTLTHEHLAAMVGRRGRACHWRSNGWSTTGSFFAKGSRSGFKRKPCAGTWNGNMSSYCDQYDVRS